MIDIIVKSLLSIIVGALATIAVLVVLSILFDIGCIIYNFYSNVREDIEEIMKEVEKEGYKTILIDYCNTIVEWIKENAIVICIITSIVAMFIIFTVISFNLIPVLLQKGGIIIQ